jgi:membrane fusion protein (multidrug efflux system)
MADGGASTTTSPAFRRVAPTPGTDADAAVPATRDPAARRRLVRWTLLILGPLLLILMGGYFYVTGGRWVSTDNAYVKADILPITTDVSGVVAEIPVHDNEAVAAGQVLFRLDDTPFRLALDSANAQLAMIRNDIEALKASYRQKQEDIRLAQVNIEFYDREFRRQQDLVTRQVTSQATFDQARHNLDAARSQLASLQQQLAGIVANLNGDPNIAPEQHPRYLQALAQRNEAARQLAHTVVKAPSAGIVTNVPSLQPGMYFQAATAYASSTTAFSLVATDHVWVEANPKETELTNMKPGQKVEVTVDTYPGVEWQGTVASLSPASGSEFSLLPAQNTSGNWVKVVQRIPIRVRIDTDPSKPILRSGMSVEIDVDTGHARGMPHILTALFGHVGGGGGVAHAAEQRP